MWALKVPSQMWLLLLLLVWPRYQSGRDKRAISHHMLSLFEKPLSFYERCLNIKYFIQPYKNMHYRICLPNSSFPNIANSQYSRDFNFIILFWCHFMRCIRGITSQESFVIVAQRVALDNYKISMMLLHVWSLIIGILYSQVLWYVHSWFS